MGCISSKTKAADREPAYEPTATKDPDDVVDPVVVGKHSSPPLVSYDAATESLTTAGSRDVKDGQKPVKTSSSASGAAVQHEGRRKHVEPTTSETVAQPQQASPLVSSHWSLPT